MTIVLIKKRVNIVAAYIFCFMQSINAIGGFVHPGGLHTLADLNRMREKVAAKEQPWIEGWNELLKDSKAQSSYSADPQTNMAISRQRASADAHAAYLNAIRWYITGDEAHARCAIKICNDWSSTVDQIPIGGEFFGLGGISISEFAMAGEVLRICELWCKEDFDRFKTMMTKYLYPVCHDFLVNHNGACVDYYWANWDANNLTALMAIGVLCDRKDIFDEGVDYFKNGVGAGSIKNAVYYVHENGLGQWQESGRDQEHGQLGVGLLGTACQIAWNQGFDLFGYDNNRLLSGAEYVARYNQMLDVPFKIYNNCQPANNKWAAINGRGRLDDRPVWELLYNHYVVRQGLRAPNVQRMAELMRPEHGSNDHFGYGTLTFTLDASHYPPHPIPGICTGLQATAGVGKIVLTWQPPLDLTATGYVIQRATSINGEFQVVDSWNDNTYTVYSDKDVTNGKTYFYRIAALNQSGIGDYSSVSFATSMDPSFLPDGWEIAQSGNGSTGSVKYSNVNESTFIVTAKGKVKSNEADTTFCYRKVVGDFELVCKVSDMIGSISKAGLMVQESLDANSPVVTMCLGEGGSRFARMGWRESYDSEMFLVLGNAYTWLPAWFKLKREGNEYTSYESSDGKVWFLVDSVNISMTAINYIGFAVVSQNNGSESTATFDSVKLKSAKGRWGIGR